MLVNRVLYSTFHLTVLQAIEGSLLALRAGTCVTFAGLAWCFNYLPSGRVSVRQCLVRDFGIQTANNHLQTGPKLRASLHCFCSDRECLVFLNSVFRNSVRNFTLHFENFLSESVMVVYTSYGKLWTTPSWWRSLVEYSYSQAPYVAYAVITHVIHIMSCYKWHVPASWPAYVSFALSWSSGCNESSL